jgi:DNA polymerase-3 subunit gamma/tau
VPRPVVSAGPLGADRWAELLAGASLRGPVREFAHNVVPIAFEDGRLRLGLAPQFEHLRSDGMLRSLTEALVPALGAGLRIQVDALDAAVDTLADRQRRERAQQQGEAEAAIAADPVVQSLIQQFDARVVPRSTRPSQPE